MIDQILYQYCITVLLLSLSASPSLFLAFTGVRFRIFFSIMVCIGLVGEPIVLVLSLLKYWPPDGISPHTLSNATATILLSTVPLILGVCISMLTSSVPEVPVYAVGVLGGGLGFWLLGRWIVSMPSGTPLFWLTKAIGGAAGAACVHFFEPYAVLVSSTALGVGPMILGLEAAFDLYVQFFQSTSMGSSLKKTALLATIQLALIAAAVGVQFWLGNHRRTCKQVRDRRKAKSLGGASA